MVEIDVPFLEAEFSHSLLHAHANEDPIQLVGASSLIARGDVPAVEAKCIIGISKLARSE